MGLKIKKSHLENGGWILYNPDNFDLHTHCRHKRVALVIKRNVEKRILPKSNDKRMLYSHIRVTRDKKYIKAIMDKIEQG